MRPIYANDWCARPRHLLPVAPRAANDACAVRVQFFSLGSQRCFAALDGAGAQIAERIAQRTRLPYNGARIESCSSAGARAA